MGRVLFIITSVLYLNPDGEEPIEGTMGYFYSPEICARIPNVFFTTFLWHAVIAIAALPLIRRNPY